MTFPCNDKRHPWCPKCRPEVAAQVSVNRKGKGMGNTNNLNGCRGYHHSMAFKAKLSKLLKGNKRFLGHKHTAKAKRLISKHRLKHLETVQNCNCAAHNYFRQPSLLAWDAYDLLLKDFRVVIPEMRFGRYSVDFLLAEEWLGIEIDGPFHKGREARDAKRDAELLEKFDLPIVRLSKKDIYQ